MLTKTNRVVCALEAPICARADPQADETRVERSNPQTRTSQLLWSFPRWLNVVRIDESGDHLLVETSAKCTLPGAAGAEHAVLELYTRGQLRKSVTLFDVYGNAPSLATAEQLGAWAQALGSPDSRLARYLLVTGQTLEFDLPLATLTIG